MAVANDFVGRIPEWVESATVKSARRMIKVGLAVADDFAKRFPDSTIKQLARQKTKVDPAQIGDLGNEIPVAKRLREKFLSSLSFGEIRRGRVQRLVGFGAYVDIEGVTCRLHINNMSWDRVRQPSEILKVGQEIDVVVVDIDR